VLRLIGCCLNGNELLSRALRALGRARFHWIIGNFRATNLSSRPERSGAESLPRRAVGSAVSDFALYASKSVPTG
jgi:hypothetical protein